MKNLLTDDRRWVLVAIACGWFCSMGVRMGYPALLPYIRGSYGLNLSTAGLLLTILWLGYALGNLPGGIITDQIGAKTVLVISTLLSAITLASVLLMESVHGLFGMTAVFGMVTGFYAVARLSALQDIFSDQVGAAIGITFAAGDAGQAVLPWLATLLAATIAWRLGLGISIPLFLIVAVALWIAFAGISTTKSTTESTFTAEDVYYVYSQLKKPEVVRTTSILVLGLSIWMAFTSFYPTYLIDMKGVSATFAGELFGLFFASGMVIKPLTGKSFDMFGARSTLAVVSIATAVSLVILPFVYNLWVIVLLTVFLSPILGFGTVANSHLTNNLPNDMMGRGLGVLRTVYSTIAAMSPYLFGVIAEVGFFDEMFWVLALISLIALLLAVRLND